MTLRFNAYVVAAEKTFRDAKGGFRRGQAYMNTLADWDRNLYRSIAKERNADPFYSDEKLDVFLQVVEEILPEYVSTCEHRPEAIVQCAKCSEKETLQRLNDAGWAAINHKSSDEVIQEIAETLAEADGDFIEKIANQVLTREVKYEGDSMFSQRTPK
jgi:hypothetical protein